MWYNKVKEDISNIETAVSYYDKELTDAAKEVKLQGNLERAASAIPGLFEYRFNQLQDIEAILEYLNIILRKEKAKLLRKFMENYNRELSAREAEKWIDGEDEIVILTEYVNDIAFIRNRYLGITKSLDYKHWQVGNIVKLRTAGLEDAEL